MLWNHTNYESAVNVLIIKDVENLGRAYMDSIVDHNGHRYHLRNNFPRRLQHGHSQRSSKCELFMLHSYYVLEKKKEFICVRSLPSSATRAFSTHMEQSWKKHR